MRHRIDDILAAFKPSMGVRVYMSKPEVLISSDDQAYKVCCNNQVTVTLKLTVTFLLGMNRD